jgi:hypothetical protein
MRSLILMVGLSAVLGLAVLLGLALWTERSDAEAEDTTPVVETTMPLPPDPEPEPEPAPTTEALTEGVVVRVDAPADRCWSATIEAQPWAQGCGPAALRLEVGSSLVVIHFERQPGPTDWHFSTAIAVDGQVVQTVGPTTEQYPSLDIAYEAP